MQEFWGLTGSEFQLASFSLEDHLKTEVKPDPLVAKRFSILQQATYVQAALACLSMINLLTVSSRRALHNTRVVQGNFALTVQYL